MAGRVELFGLQIDNVTMAEAVEAVGRLARSGGKHYVVTPNVDHVVRASKDAEFLAMCRGASLVLADGAPIVWASRWVGRPLQGRVTGSDLVPRVCELAAREGLRIYILGTTDAIAQEAIRRMRQQWPSLQIAGNYAPPFGFDADWQEQDRILQAINTARAEIVFVALGSPKQERWTTRWMPQLDARVVLCIGAGIDYLAGAVRRAPRWMQRVGLEWLWRLLQEPGRLWRRYLVEDMAFARLVALELAKARGQRSSTA